MKNPSLRPVLSPLIAWQCVNFVLGDILLARTSAGLGGLWFSGQKNHPGTLSVPERPHDDLLLRVGEQLADYFAGRRVGFDVPLDVSGTPFQKSVWSALLTIAPGQTCSYTDIAQQVGRPQAVRAVGMAVGKNPVSVIVPCHRVVGARGTLTGYAGGLDRKRALLTLEANAHMPIV
jgi:methylated-DNA-[protein]-cysteine S-methyltransferase